MKELKNDFDFSFMHEISAKMSQDLNNKLDKVITDSLFVKGYSFESKPDLLEFIKENCKCEDNIHLKEKTYFVFNKPFLLFNYNMQIETIKTDDTITMFSEYGKYSLL